MIARNPTIAHPLLVALLTNPDPERNNPMPFLDVLPFLPPTLASFDLLGRLLRDDTRVTVQGYNNVAELVTLEVLGRFTRECIDWLDHAELDEREGRISDDRFAKGVQNVWFLLCSRMTEVNQLVSYAGSTIPSSNLALSIPPRTRQPPRWHISPCTIQDTKMPTPSIVSLLRHVYDSSLRTVDRRQFLFHYPYLLRMSRFFPL